MEELVAEINRALRRRGLSAREASMRAVGTLKTDGWTRSADSRWTPPANEPGPAPPVSG